MKGLSSNLQFTLRDLAGTPFRFAFLLFAQVAGFTLTILHLGLSMRQIIDLAVWGLVTPVLFLITLRCVVVQLQKDSASKEPRP
jgi:hypothetical protein